MMNVRDYNHEYYQKNKKRLQDTARKYWHTHKADPEFRQRRLESNKRNHAKRIMRHRSYVNATRARIKAQVIVKLGGRCSSPGCKWINDDGTRGCTNARCLQLDHINGGGKAERRKMGVDRIYRKALKDSTGYQLLCANCNWIKRFERKEHNLCDTFSI